RAARRRATPRAAEPRRSGGRPVEELVALIIQVVVEVGLQLFGAVGIDWATGASDKKGDKEEAGCGWLFIFALLGAACGGLSLMLVPKLVLPTLGLRIANLVVAPLAAGGLSYLIAKHVWAAGQWPPPHHFWRGFWFALVFGIVRFAYVHR